MRAELICLGNELLAGKINSHGAYCARVLRAAGIELAGIHTAGDSIPEIARCVRAALKRSDLLFLIGGLGPTWDDVTRGAVARVLGRSLVRDNACARDLTKKIMSSGRTPSVYDMRQADLIQGGRFIDNACGMAPGMLIKEKGTYIYLLPGPLRELSAMLGGKIIPFLKKKSRRRMFLTRTINIFDRAESDVDRLVRPVMDRIHDRYKEKIRTSIVAEAGVVSIAITLYGSQKNRIAGIVRSIQNHVSGALAGSLVSWTYPTLPEAIAGVLVQQKKTVACAESCTGGLLGGALTRIPGSSRFFKQGVIVYSNESKISLLGIPRKLLLREGAVSARVAGMMARRIRRRSRVDCALSVTGIAGPGGGSVRKPVGTVFVGIADSRGTAVEQCRFYGDRLWIRHQAVHRAMVMLLKRLRPCTKE